MMLLGKDVIWRCNYINLLQVEDASGDKLELSSFQGKVILISNVASRCGYTAGNYKAFANLATPGLEILAYPCNQFGQQAR